MAFSKTWLEAVRGILKQSGTIWISGTYHNIFHVAHSLTEITARLREHLMGSSHLPELLSLDRKTLAKPPDWNAPRQLEFFGEFVT